MNAKKPIRCMACEAKLDDDNSTTGNSTFCELCNINVYRYCNGWLIWPPPQRPYTCYHCGNSIDEKTSVHMDTDQNVRVCTPCFSDFVTQFCNQ